MSLDVYLMGKSETKTCVCTHCGHQHQSEIEIELFEQNITHNLASMAQEAGIYEYLWRPEEKEIEVAKDLIEPLTKGLQNLSQDPQRFKKHNPTNGWGTYEGLCAFVAKYIHACKENPEATVKVSR